MANFTISDFQARKDSNDYTTGNVVVQINNTFDVKFTLKNTSSHSLRYWSIVARFLQGTTIIGERWLYGTSAEKNGGTRVKNTSGSSVDVSAGKTIAVVLTGSGITPASMGMNTTNRADRIQVCVYGWISEDGMTGGSPHMSIVYESTNVTFLGECHYPTISSFSVARNGNDTTQLKLIAKGSYTAGATDFGERVSFQVSIDGGAWQDVTSVSGGSADGITVSTLCAGISKNMNLTLDKDSYATFALTFYNDYETSGTPTSYVSRVFANLHLAGLKTGGVSIGAFSTSTLNNPKFECTFPAYFYGGVYGATDKYASGDTVTLTGGTFYGYATSGSTKIVVTVPLRKSLENISSATVTNFMANIANNGGYCITSGYVEGGSSYMGSAITRTVSVFPETNTLQISMTRSSEFDCTNNDTLQVRNETLVISLT